MPRAVKQGAPAPPRDRWKRLLLSSPWTAALGKLRRFPTFSWADRLLLSEAFLLFWCARLSLRWIAFRRIAGRLGSALPPGSFTPASLSAEEEGRTRRIGWAVTRVAAHLPLEGTCLPQGLAAAVMLRRRRLPAGLYFGVRLASQPLTMEAHAWVRAGTVDVTGYPVPADFQEISCIAVRQNRSPSASCFL